MQTTPVTYRMATSNDVPQLVALHCKVFDVGTHKLLLLGKPFMNQAYKWYCESPHAFTVVAVADHNIVGCTTVNEGSYYSVFWQNLRHLAGALVTQPTLCFHPMVRERVASLTRKPARLATKPSVSHSAYLAYLAVDSSARGQGVGGNLLTVTLMECQKRGWANLLTSFHRANVSARFLYKTLGFEEFPEINTEDLVGVRISTMNANAAKAASLLTPMVPQLGASQAMSLARV